MTDENIMSMLEEERADLIEEAAQILTLKKRKDEVVSFYKKHPFKVFFGELEKTGVNKQSYFCFAVCLVSLLMAVIVFTSFAPELEGTRWLALVWGIFGILSAIFIALTVTVIVFLVINIKKYSVIKNDTDLKKCHERLSEINQKTGHSDEETEESINKRCAQMLYLYI